MTELRESSSTGQSNVDIRVLLLSLVIAMSAAFFAGLNMGPGEVPAVSELYDAFMAASFPKADSNTASKTVYAMDRSLDGEQLMVDLSQFTDVDFLTSMERLEAAMKQTAEEAGLAGWQCRCHEVSKEEKSGVSCVAFSQQSHISVHTWPKAGVATVDIFVEHKYKNTFNPLVLVSMVEVIERIFSMGKEKLMVKWAHELRSFPFSTEADDKQNKFVVDSSSDLANYVTAQMEMYTKIQLYSNVTKYNRVDIWEYVELEATPSYEDSIQHNLKHDDPRWDSPELVMPDRVMFVNGGMQKLLSNDIEVHEGLVHPAMFAHPNPVHVAIVGGIEGGVLREVLKHNTIEAVTMINEDEELVQLSRHFMPRMSDCSDFLGRAADCFDDEKATLVYEDPRKWFPTHFGEESNSKTAHFDVIIVDHRDPQEDEEFYTDSSFMSAMVDSLSEQGVMVIRSGRAPDIENPRADKGSYPVRETMLNLLEANENIAAIMIYEEARMGLTDPTAMVVVCRDVNCRSHWYARSDQVDFAIYERIVRTKSKERSLSYFDGTTQYSYQALPKAWENVYCRRSPTPFECAYTHLDLNREIHDLVLDNEEESSFEVERIRDENDAVVETKVIATVDIPKGSYIMPEHMASSLIITERNLQGLRENVEVGGGRVSVIEDLLQFIDEHSHETHTEGTGVHFVEIGGSCMIRIVENKEDANVGRWVPPHPSGKRPSYSPVYERHRVSFDVFLIATKDIAKGSEVLRHSSLWED